MNIAYLIIAGAMLGISVGIVFITLGKVVGISGISKGLLQKVESWRIAFLVGIIGSGILFQILFPQNFDTPKTGSFALILGGLFVGFGTSLCNGCTCGHGICGNARFSQRSMIATLIFIATGAFTVWMRGGVQ